MLPRIRTLTPFAVLGVLSALSLSSAFAASSPSITAIPTYVEVHVTGIGFGTALDNYNDRILVEDFDSTNHLAAYTYTNSSRTSNCVGRLCTTTGGIDVWLTGLWASCNQTNHLVAFDLTTGISSNSSAVYVPCP